MNANAYCILSSANDARVYPPRPRANAYDFSRMEADRFDAGVESGAPSADHQGP